MDTVKVAEIPMEIHQPLVEQYGARLRDLVIEASRHGIVLKIQEKDDTLEGSAKPKNITDTTTWTALFPMPFELDHPYLQTAFSISAQAVYATKVPTSEWELDSVLAPDASLVQKLEVDFKRPEMFLYNPNPEMNKKAASIRAHVEDYYRKIMPEEAFAVASEHVFPAFFGAVGESTERLSACLSMCKGISTEDLVRAVKEKDAILTLEKFSEKKLLSMAEAIEARNSADSVKVLSSLLQMMVFASVINHIKNSVFPVVALKEIDFDDPESLRKHQEYETFIRVTALNDLLNCYYTGGGEPDKKSERLKEVLAVTGLQG